MLEQLTYALPIMWEAVKAMAWIIVPVILCFCMGK